MRIGQLDHRLTIRRRLASTTDAYGRPTPGSEVIATVWANVREVAARERVGAPQLLPVRTAAITIRYRADVTADLEVVDGARTWAIKGLAELGRREWLQITAEEIEVRT